MSGVKASTSTRSYFASDDNSSFYKVDYSHKDFVEKTKVRCYYTLEKEFDPSDKPKKVASNIYTSVVGDANAQLLSESSMDLWSYNNTKKFLYVTFIKS